MPGSLPAWDNYYGKQYYHGEQLNASLMVSGLRCYTPVIGKITVVILVRDRCPHGKGNLPSLGGQGALVLNPWTCGTATWSCGRAMNGRPVYAVKHFGQRKKYDMLGVYLQRSAIVLTVTAIPITIIYIFSRPILLLLGQSPSMASAAALFVYGLIPQIFAYAINFPIQKFLQAQMAGQFTYILMSDRCKDTWTGFNSKAFGGLWDFVKLSSGSAVMLCLETWYFQILVLIAGLLENPELALDALSVCMGVQGLLFMVSVGFNAAASVRVGNELGAGNPKAAAFSVWMVTSVSFIIAVVESIIILSVRDVLSYAFTTGETVANEVSDLCPLLVITIILNGIQPVLSGVAVGCGWQAYVAYVNIGCYYVVGIPLGFILGFYFDLGVKGIWSGMVGGTGMQTLILLWSTFRTDWNKEVDIATKRLNKWEANKETLLKE
ncbi:DETOXIFICATION 40-like protein [Tanacetum coccineum]|uniref:DETOXIFICATION 40-like protein n=1 Tax=Tanacetum coccineum TaxID=301880 RepID=A0ABQ4XLD8_9ASTR